MLLKVIDSYCSGLHFEATNKSRHVSYLEYYKVVEILADKEFKRFKNNTIAQDEITKLIKILFNKKAYVSASKLETYANEINKMINNMLSADPSYLMPCHNYH